MLERHGIEIDPSLQLPDCPVPFVHVMFWFQQLSRQRRQAMAGAHPFVWADMQAWSQLTGERPQEHEWDMIAELDHRFRKAANAAKATQDKRREGAPRQR
jgi:hypothetical protein